MGRQRGLHAVPRLRPPSHLGGVQRQPRGAHRDRRAVLPVQGHDRQGREPLRHADGQDRVRLELREDPRHDRVALARPHRPHAGVEARSYVEGDIGSASDDGFYNPKAKDYPLSMVSPVSVLPASTPATTTTRTCARTATATPCGSRAWTPRRAAYATATCAACTATAARRCSRRYVTNRMTPGTAAVHHGAWYQTDGAPAEMNRFGQDLRGRAERPAGRRASAPYPGRAHHRGPGGASRRWPTETPKGSAWRRSAAATAPRERGAGPAPVAGRRAGRTDHPVRIFLPHEPLLRLPVRAASPARTGRRVPKPGAEKWMTVYECETGKRSRTSACIRLAFPCAHCEDPPRASRPASRAPSARRNEFGAVLVDQDQCHRLPRMLRRVPLRRAPRPPPTSPTARSASARCASTALAGRACRPPARSAARCARSTSARSTRC